jgi:type I restriction enzyme S subunit
MVGVAGQKRVPSEFVKDFTLELPPLAQQRRIAHFLDIEVGHAHRLLELRRHAIDLLRERINATRTRMALGRNEHEKKASPVPGLRQIPASWSVGHLRRFGVEVQTGPFGSLLHASDYITDGIPVVNPANLQGGRIAPDRRVTVNEATRGRLGRYVLRPGDIVFARRGELGRVALVTDAEKGWICGTGCLRLRLHDSVLTPRFLALYLSLDLMRQYFKSFSVGSTLDNLNSELLLTMPVLVPPYADQERITEVVDAAVAHHTHLTNKMSLQAALMTERRDALITEAVTGQVALDSYHSSMVAK